MCIKSEYFFNHLGGTLQNGCPGSISCACGLWMGKELGSEGYQVWFWGNPPFSDVNFKWDKNVLGLMNMLSWCFSLNSPITTESHNTSVVKLIFGMCSDCEYVINRCTVGLYGFGMAAWAPSQVWIGMGLGFDFLGPPPPYFSGVNFKHMSYRPNTKKFVKVVRVCFCRVLWSSW